MLSHDALPSMAQGITQGEYEMYSSSVNTVIFDDGSCLLAADAAVIPAAPDPITIMFLAIGIPKSPSDRAIYKLWSCARYY